MATPFLSDNPVIEGFEEQLQDCERKQLTGFLQVNGVAAQWHVCFLQGHIVWVKSRIHAARRWRRYLAIHSPTFFTQLNRLGNPPYQDWDYAAIARQVKLKQFRRDHFIKITEKCIVEELFDIIYIGTNQYRALKQTLSYRKVNRQAADLSYVLIQQHGLWKETRERWDTWARFGLTRCSPDWAPLIVQPDKLKTQTPTKTFEILSRFVNGDRTLQDLSLQLKQPITTLTKVLLPYVSRRLLKLVEVPDLATEMSRTSAASARNSLLTHSTAKSTDEHNYQVNSVVYFQTVTEQIPPVSNVRKDNIKRASISSFNSQPFSVRASQIQKRRRPPTIVYVDNSPDDSRLMSNILKITGYRYSNILNPLTALPLLIETRPDLIFIDLVMPRGNGYEVCAQIRRTAAMIEIPIIIITDNCGIADRVRAKVVGASGFMARPIHKDRVLEVLHKHLHNQPVLS